MPIATRGQPVPTAKYDFVQSDGALPAPWTTPSGLVDVAVVSNRAQVSVAVSNCMAIYDAGAWGEGQYSEVELTTFNPGVDGYMGPLARYASGSDNGYLTFIASPFSDATTLILGKRVNSTFSSFHTFGTFKFPIHAGDKLGLLAMGPNIFTLLNRSIVLNAIDQTFPDGNPGILLSNSTGAASDVELTNWKGFTAAAYLNRPIISAPKARIPDEVLDGYYSLMRVKRWF